MDARVAAGEKALDLTLGRIRKTIALLEPMVEKLRMKPKAKSLYTVDLVEADSQERSMDFLYRVDTRLTKSGKWWDSSLKYPCMIEAHKHELYQCSLFLGMSLKERHEKLKGRICRTCLKPGGDLYQRKEV